MNAPTPIADMVERMLAEGAPAVAIVAAVRALEGVRYLSATSPQTSADKSADRRRAADRERKRSHRALRGPDAGWKALVQRVIERDGGRCFYCGSGEKLCADHKVPLSRGGTNDPSNLCACCRNCNLKKGSRTAEEWLSNGKQTMPVDLSALSADASLVGTNDSLLFKNLSVMKKEESKKEVVTRARGTRLKSGETITLAFIEAAQALGAQLARIPAMWDEFVDYWSAVPGSRGCKLDWLATWRNRVRQIVSKGNLNGKAKGGSLIAELDRLLEESIAQEDDLAAGENVNVRIPYRPVRG
jgi:hypothetical protein